MVGSLGGDAHLHRGVIASSGIGCRVGKIFDITAVPDFAIQGDSAGAFGADAGLFGHLRLVDGKGGTSQTQNQDGAQCYNITFLHLFSPFCVK
jgi:hypothetical protein